MALVVETGAGLADAESLISVAEARDYATKHGLTLPTPDSEVEVLCRLASEWLGGMEDRLQGFRRVGTQGLCFPRIGVQLYGRGIALIPNTLFLAYIPEEVIHPDLKKGLCQLVFEMTQRDPNPTVDGLSPTIASETVGPITTTYSRSGLATQNAAMPKVMAYLQPFFKNSQLSLVSSRA